jgi:hypothetical protein
MKKIATLSIGLTLAIATLTRPAYAHCVNGDAGCVEPLTVAQARQASQRVFDTAYQGVSAETDWACVSGGQGILCTRLIRITGELSSMECEATQDCYYDSDWGAQVCDVNVTCTVSSDESSPDA